MTDNTDHAARKAFDNQGETRQPDELPSGDAVIHAVTALEYARNNVHCSRLEWEMHDKAACGLKHYWQVRETQRKVDMKAAQQILSEALGEIEECYDLGKIAQSIANIWGLGGTTKRESGWVLLKDAPLDTLGFLWAKGFERMGTPDMGRVFECYDGTRGAYGACKGFVYSHWMALMDAPKTLIEGGQS